MAMTHSPGSRLVLARFSGDQQLRSRTAEMRRWPGRSTRCRRDVQQRPLAQLAHQQRARIHDWTAEEHVGPAEWLDEWLAMERPRARPPRNRTVARQRRPPQAGASYLREMNTTTASPCPPTTQPDAQFRRSYHDELHGAADPHARARLSSARSCATCSRTSRQRAHRGRRDRRAPHEPGGRALFLAPRRVRSVVPRLVAATTRRCSASARRAHGGSRLGRNRRATAWVLVIFSHAGRRTSSPGMLAVA